MIFDIGTNIVNRKYQIEEYIDKGAFGEVFRALDLQLERKVAVKVIQKTAEGSTSSEYLDYETRFKQEARIGAQIRDDNVIAVYGLENHDENTLVLIMEYASGGSLKRRVSSTALSPQETVDIGIQICKGVAAIQRPPIEGVHRDIKPTNILFDDLGRVKVADLGLVQIYGMSGQRSIGLGGAQPGTPGL